MMQPVETEREPGSAGRETGLWAGEKSIYPSKQLEHIIFVSCVIIIFKKENAYNKKNKKKIHHTEHSSLLS